MFLKKNYSTFYIILLTGVPSLNQSTDGAGSAVTSHMTLKSLPLVAYWFSLALFHVIATEI